MDDLRCIHSRALDLHVDHTFWREIIYFQISLRC